MPAKHRYIIAYDIVDDKVRARAANILKDYGVRVQKSVFDCRITSAALDRLKSKLGAVIDPKVDSILIYILCEACVKQKQSLGLTVTNEEEAFRIL